jgi:hypothetical protein
VTRQVPFSEAEHGATFAELSKQLFARGLEEDNAQVLI